MFKKLDFLKSGQLITGLSKAWIGTEKGTILPIVAPDNKYYHTEIIYSQKFTTYNHDSENSYNSSGTLRTGSFSVTNIQNKIMYATALNITLVGAIDPVIVSNEGNKIDVDIAMNVTGDGGTATVKQNVLDHNNALVHKQIYFGASRFPGINLPMRDIYKYGNDRTTIDTNGGSLTVELYYTVSDSTAFRHIFVTAPACTLTLQITAIY